MSELSQEAKDHINAYLISKVKLWGTVIGIVNVLAFIGAACYIYFVLPGRMADQATENMSMLNKRATDMLIDATVNTAKAGAKCDNALDRADRLAGDILKLNEETDKMRNNVNKLQNDIDVFLKSQHVSVAEIAGLLDSHRLEEFARKQSIINFKVPPEVEKHQINILGGISYYGKPIVSDIEIAICKTAECPCKNGWIPVQGDLNSRAKDSDFVQLCVKHAS